MSVSTVDSAFFSVVLNRLENWNSLIGLKLASGEKGGWRVVSTNTVGFNKVFTSNRSEGQSLTFLANLWQMILNVLP